MRTLLSSGGHFPVASSAGLIACGAGTITVYDLRAERAERAEVLGGGYYPVWVTPLTLVYINPTGPLTAERHTITFDADPAKGYTRVVQPSDDQWGCNAAAGGGGWWVAWRAVDYRVLTVNPAGTVKVWTQGTQPVGRAEFAGTWLVFPFRVSPPDQPEQWVMQRIDVRDETATFFPTVLPVHDFSMHASGVLTYAYNSPARALSLHNGHDTDITVTPWAREGPVRIHATSLGLWVWSATFDGRAASVIGRPYGVVAGEPVVQVVGMDAAHGLAVTTYRAETVVVASSATGVLTLTIPDLTRRVRLRPFVPPIPEPKIFGHFFQFSQRTNYGDYPDYPAKHATVIVDHEFFARVPDHLDIIYGVDVRTERGWVLDHNAIRNASNNPKRVLAFYLGIEGTPAEAGALADQLRRLWADETSNPCPPILWYITEKYATVGMDIPASIDWFGPEFYFPPGLTDEQLAGLLWRKMGKWIEVLGRDRPWIPIVQAFDRSNPLNTAEVMAAIARLQAAFLRMLVDPDPRYGDPPPNLGLLTFSVGRPGGARDYPLIRAWHEAVAAAIPDGPVSIPRPNPPTPPEEEETPVAGRLPNHDQAVNALQRIALKYAGWVKTRPHGVFSVPGDGADVAIMDPKRADVGIDTKSLAVWGMSEYTGRFFRSTAGDPHEDAIRQVEAALDASHEGQANRPS